VGGGQDRLAPDAGAVTVPIEIRLLGAADGAVLRHVAPEVFDHALDERWTAEFFADARHHLVVAIDEGVVVGMASAVHYVHPDKAPELWINEVGVAPTHHRRGIGRMILDTLLAHGRALGCREAWVATEEENVAARRLYESVGGEGEEFIMYSFDLEAGDAAE
jgi:aminoglycoside 6'-N-acetyltransferase I